MRRALMGLALALSFALAGAALAAPVLHLSGWKASAGNAETFTITRVSGNGAATVSFKTGAPGDVAQPGIDYAATNVIINWQPKQVTAQVKVPTLPNAAYAGHNITFTATITVAGKATSALGLIMEPAAPPPPSATQTCPDGSVIPAASTCPPPPPATQWVSAPLQDGGFARVKNANDSQWPMTGPSGRPLVNGEIVAVYFNGWGYEANGQPSFAIYALSDGTSGRALAGDLEGVAPAGTPPPLPADWWTPGLVTANKTCGSATQPGQPGVVQGGTYRAAMLSGTHMKLADGVTGAPSVMWLVFASGAQQYTTGEVVVMGDCLTGQ